jgi:sialate O-acetylesterase
MARTKADEEGSWSVCLEPMPASAEPADLVVTGRTTVTVRDVLVGDVWLASGQSNMEFPVKSVLHAEKEIAQALSPRVRHLKVEHAVATVPLSDFRTNGWQAASPGTVGEFAAVGYFFARKISERIGVPVGIIDSTWGGTTIEAWMSDPARRSTSIAGSLEARWRKALAEWPPERVARYPADMAAWQRADDWAKANGTPNLLPWPQPPAANDSPALPGGLFNAMIAPLQPCALRGILWYQGESNAERPGEYAELFQAMIRSWRAGWEQGELPFYFVQIANYDEKNDRSGRDWARLRDAQATALALPATGMAVTIDIGQAGDIHPVNKQDVGNRLALIAEAGTYGLHVACQGPVFAGAAREGAGFRIRFNGAGLQLAAQGMKVHALEVAGEDRVFHEASGTIETDTLLLASPEVPEPVAVRYAWSNAPAANLYGYSGLPAVPFRTDDW